MPAMQKDQMLNEMRAIHAAKVALIANEAGEDAALSYLGAPSFERNWSELPHELIDLNRYPITDLMLDGLGYALRPQLRHTRDRVEELMLHCAPFVNSVFYGETIINPYLHVEPVACRTVVEMVSARYDLDFAESDLTIQQLALLADMNEGSVRNSTRAEGETRLETYNSGKRTYVKHSEALRWLSGRKGYVPSPIHKAAPVGAGDVLSARSTQELGVLLTRLRAHQNRGKDDMAQELGWSADKLLSWENGTYKFGVDDGLSLARTLGLDPMILLPKALELELRRDGVA